MPVAAIGAGPERAEGSKNAHGQARRGPRDNVRQRRRAASPAQTDRTRRAVTAGHSARCGVRAHPTVHTRSVRRARVPALTIACLALAAAGIALARPPARVPWPFARLQLGLTSSPGGAAGIAAVAPFGLRYQYLAGGVNTGHGWQGWDPAGTFVSRYIAESEAHHIVPVFSYYQIRQSLPGSGNTDEPAADLGNLDDTATMRAYYLDLKEFFTRAAGAHLPVVLHLEPDLFGYIEQAAGARGAPSVPAAVASTGIAALAGLPNTAAGFAQAVLTLRHDYAPRVIVGYPISIWGTGLDIHLNHPSPATVDRMAAQSVAFYRSLGADFDVSFTEVADRDAGYAVAVGGQRGAWWHAVDFARDLRFLADYHRRVRTGIVMWQIPLGNTVSPVVNNTPYHYRDNRVQWFLGPGNRAHVAAYARAGLVALLFGGGQGPIPTRARPPATEGPTTAGTSTPAPARTTPGGRSRSRNGRSPCRRCEAARERGNGDECVRADTDGGRTRTRPLALVIAMAADHILWFNPRCGTAKKALGLLTERGIEPEIRLYLTQPPTRAELERLLDELEGPLAEVARAKEPSYAELGLSATSSRDELIAAILERPILLQRPILQTAGRAVIARPAERALELL